MGEIAPRNGPRTLDYLADFLQFLRQRIHFNGDTIEAPIAFQRVLEQMEAVRFPRQFWKALLNVAVRVMGSISDKLRDPNLVNVVINVVISVFFWFTNSWLLRAALLFLSFLPSEFLIKCISSLYNFISLALERVARYVFHHLRSYSNLVTYKLDTITNCE